MPEIGTARPAVEIADAGVRRRALTAAASFLVRAPAGAGKTELLVQRFLTLLATVEEPESVVALTFTRKAAAEMRKRVLDALAAAGAAEPEAPHARHTWQLARAAAVRDAQRGWNLLSTPSRLRVTTMDALALALVGRMPWSARLGAAPAPSEQAEEMYRAAAQAALVCVEDQPSTADSAAARALLELADGDWSYAAVLLAEMLGHRDQWLAPVLQAPENLRVAMEAGFAAQLEADLAEVRARVAADPPAAAALVSLAADADPPPTSPVAACRGLRELPPARMEAMPAWLGLVHLATTQEKGAARKRGDKRDGLVSKELRARLQQLALGENVLQALHGLRHFPRLPFEESFWTRLEALRRLLPRAVAELRMEFHARGECDFTEITLAACQALREPGSTVAYALDAQLRHLLVDEFQDTSTAHFEFLQALVQDWQPGDGRTLFLVGDPMQSIYLFRNARVDLFLRAAQGRLGGVDLEVLQLTSNFRSQAGLVDWCNQKFAQVFPAREEARLGQVRFHPATSVHAAEAPAVEMHVEAFEDPTSQARQAAAVARRELQSDSRATVAILVHSRGHLRELLPELRAQGLDFQGVKLAALDRSQVAEDLLALAQAIANPSDRLAWLALLRAPWCGLSLAELHAVAGGAAAGESIASLWTARAGALPDAARRRGQRVMEVVGEAARARGRVPPRALVEWCWRMLGGPECLAPTALADEADEVLEALELAGGDVEMVRRRLQNSYARGGPGEEQRLQIMTLHQAKGLEFDIVILPGLSRQPRPLPARLLEWMDCETGGEAPPWLLAVRGARRQSSPPAEYLRRRRAAMEEQERLRRLYVAATRARRRLHLFAGLPPGVQKPAQPRARAPLAGLWPALREEILTQLQPPAEPPTVAAARARAARAAATAGLPAEPPASRLRRVSDGWQPAALRPEVRWEAAAVPPPAVGITAPRHAGAVLLRQVGVAVHALLQAMAVEGDAAGTPARVDLALRRAGVAPDALAAARSRARRAIESTLADARGRWILASHPEAHNEWPLTGVVEGRLHHTVVDRSFVTEEDGVEVRWVVDYKNAAHDGGDREGFLDQQVEVYRPQLALYAALVGRMEERAVRCGLYFPLLAAWREVPLL